MDWRLEGTALLWWALELAHGRPARQGVRVLISLEKVIFWSCGLLAGSEFSALVASGGVVVCSLLAV